MSVRKITALLASAIMIFASQILPVHAEGANAAENEHDARYEERIQSVTYYPDADKSAEFFKSYYEALQAWASGDTEQRFVIGELITREFGEHESNTDIVINLEDADLHAELDTFLASLENPVINLESPEEACSHNGAKTTVNQYTKQGGPNGQYCEWGTMTIVKYCDLCRQPLEIVCSASYVQLHTWVALPPNIQFCTRCNYPY